MATQPGRRAALRAWRRLLGAGHVLTDEATTSAAATTTFPTRQRVVGIIRPGTVNDVAACLRVATRHRVPLHPVSRGRNWGWGSRVPPRDGCVLLDLARLRRIVHFDETLACVTVEPGVSFGQLARFLARRRSRLCPPAVGSSPEASVVGNVAERGLWGSPYGDAFSHVADLEAILPTGERVRTGVARWPGARAAHLQRWGLGPYVDGLFTQSSLGVIVRLTVWLEPRPALCDVLEFQISDARLARAVDTVRRAGLDRRLRASVVLSSLPRELALRGPYPWSMTGGRAPLPRRTMATLRRQGQWPAWAGRAVLGYTAPLQRAAERALLRAALEPVVGRLRFRPVDPASLGGSGGSLHLAYWRARVLPTGRPDPDRDRSGVIFCAPVVPSRGSEVRRVVTLTTGTMRAHGFDPVIAIRALTPRTVVVLAYLLFDRTEPAEADRALRGHRALSRRLWTAGYRPARLGIQDVGGARRGSGPDPLLRRLKRALDPRGVLAPGPYDVGS